MGRHRALVYSGAIAWTLLASVPARASTVTVNVLTDLPADVCPATCSLRAALAAAQAGDEIVFSVSGSIELTAGLGPLVVARNVTITGPGPGPADLFLDGGNALSILQVNGGITAAVSRMTLYRGRTTGDGGAIHNQGILTLTSAVIRNGHADGSGGGIYSTGGALVLIDTTVDTNFAAVAGGGIATFETTLTLNGCTISGNLANLRGGGLSVGGAPVALVNTTVTRNIVFTAGPTLGGGGIFNLAQMTLLHSTVVGNSASGGGGVYNFPGTSADTFLQATILAGNLGANCSGESGSFSSTGDNISDDSTCVNADPLVNDRNDLAPMFDGLLQDNGGPTWTLALQAGSPAVNGVTHNACPPPSTDQRGVPRPSGAQCDIGAYELVPQPVDLLSFEVE